MEKQPICSMPDCPMIEKYGDRKIRKGWEYFYCPVGREAYCLMEQMKNRPLHKEWICPVHNAKLIKRHYPKLWWEK